MVFAANFIVKSRHENHKQSFREYYLNHNRDISTYTIKANLSRTLTVAGEFRSPTLEGRFERRSENGVRKRSLLFRLLLDANGAAFCYRDHEFGMGVHYLGGLNVALALYSPGHMLETKWQVALYLDETASEGQKNALTQIFTGQAGGHLSNLGPLIGEVPGSTSAPIEYGANGK
jgi:hypothetical protein